MKHEFGRGGIQVPLWCMKELCCSRAGSEAKRGVLKGVDQDSIKEGVKTRPQEGTGEQGS